MKIRSLEELEEKINEDFAWRKRELIAIKTLIEEDDLYKDIFIRSGISLLCAHWEGFIRYTANMYIVYVGELKISTKDLKDNFLALSLRKNIISSGKTEKNSVHTNLVKKIEELKEKNFYIRYTDDKRIIKTNSNLSFDLFSEILLTINLDNQYELKKNYIDYNLLKNRHDIVHGERTRLEDDDFITTFSIVLDIMECFKDQILDAADKKLYLRESI